MLQGWDNFYTTAATAGATLIGLLFVVVTLGTGMSASSAVHGVRAFVTPTLAHFGGVLFLSLVMLVPWPSAWPPSIIVGLSGLVGLAYLGKVILMQSKVDFVLLHWLDWIPYRGFPALANASLIAGAIGLIGEKSFAPYAFASAIVLLLFVGIYGAWDLTVWIIKNRNAT
jgi:hypothetical protein